jgi:hypothetical protein
VPLVKQITGHDVRRWALESLTRQARSLAVQAEEIERRAADVQRVLRRVRRMGGGRWLNVRKVKLVREKLYFVRRTNGRGSRRKGVPALARWTAHGWRHTSGNVCLEVLEPAASSRSSVEVWC